MIEDRHSTEKVIEVDVYTDGSCKKIGTHMTFGGWSYIAVRDGKIIYEASDGEINTTNQRMELNAIASALAYFKENRAPSERIVIYSDSAYVINCYTQHWYEKWMLNGWVNSKGESVANQDLWRKIIPFFDNFWYSFRKVKGHAGVFWNEKCDKMAQMEADKLKINWRGQNG